MSRRICIRGKQRTEQGIDRLARALLQAARAATEPQKLWETKHTARTPGDIVRPSPGRLGMTRTGLGLTPGYDASPGDTSPGVHSESCPD